MDPAIHAMHLRASQWFRYENTCRGKVNYKSEATGIKAAKVMTRKLKSFMEAHPCSFCDGWHIRHRLPPGLVLYFSMPEPHPDILRMLACTTCALKSRHTPYTHTFAVPQWPGDLYICWECAQVYAVNEDLDLVALTEQQLQQLIEEVHDEQRREHQGSGVCPGGDGPASTS